MNACPVDYLHGIPEGLRVAAAELYDAAFGAKFSIAVRDRDRRIGLLAACFSLEYAVAAVSNGRLVGIAGFQTGEGSLTGGITWGELKRRLGLLRAIRAAAVFRLFDRKPITGQLLMDGIAVDPALRGAGIGTRLLEDLVKLASGRGYTEIRLDVVETNPGVRRLYERNGFMPIKTERYPYLRWLLGFGASTTMVRRL